MLLANSALRGMKRNMPRQCVAQRTHIPTDVMELESGNGTFCNTDLMPASSFCFFHKYSRPRWGMLLSRLRVQKKKKKNPRVKVYQYHKGGRYIFLFLSAAFAAVRWWLVCWSVGQLGHISVAPVHEHTYTHTDTHTDTHTNTHRHTHRSFARYLSTTSRAGTRRKDVVFVQEDK